MFEPGDDVMLAAQHADGCFQACSPIALPNFAT
jgi:hypothetical protein